MNISISTAQTASQIQQGC